MKIKRYFIIRYYTLSDLCNLREKLHFNNTFYCKNNEVSRLQFITEFIARRDEKRIFVVETLSGRLKEICDREEYRKSLLFLKRYSFKKDEDEKNIFEKLKFEELENFWFYKDIKLSEKEKKFLFKLSEKSLKLLEEVYLDCWNIKDRELDSLHSLIKEAREYDFLFQSDADSIAAIPSDIDE